MFKLLIEDEEGGTRVVPVVHDEITIGRDAGNTIHLTDRNVSRKHGRLVRENGRLFVEAVAARYGLRKNGKVLTQREEFREGDVLRIGDYRVTLQAEVKAPPPGLKAPPGVTRSGGFSDEVTQVTSINSAAREHTQIMPAMPAKLVVISSNFAGQEFPLNRDEVVIGRGDDCHVIIDHRSISTKHAKIVRESNTIYKIVDLNSKNGVKVSGEEYRATHLKRGDIVELGHVKFRFVEPGENYVFTAQAAGFEDSFDQPVSSGGNKKTPMLIGIAVLLGVLIVGGVFALKGSGDPTPSGDAVAVVAPSVAGSPVQDRAQEAIEKAGTDLAAGQLQRAVGALESVRDHLDPSPAQITQINEMLSQARNEQPFQRAYMQARELADGKQYIEALERIESIPSHSLFQKLLEQEGLTQSVLDGAVSTAQAQSQQGDAAGAREIVENILAFDSENVPARQLLAQLDKAPGRGQAAVAVAQPAVAQEQASAPAETVVAAKAPATTKTKTSTRKKAPTISAEAANELFRSAGRKFMGGDPRGAITDCQQGLSGGHIECHRILGLAYTQINDNRRACNHYRQYLRTNPKDSNNITVQMSKLDCDS